MVFGWGLDCSGPLSSVSMGVGPPMFSVAEALPSGAVLTDSRTSPFPGEVLWDSTSVSSAVGGGEARGGVSLSIISGSKEFPSDDDCWGRSLARLKSTPYNVLDYNHKDRIHIRHPRVLTSQPGASTWGAVRGWLRHPNP